MLADAPGRSGAKHASPAHVGGPRRAIADTHESFMLQQAYAQLPAPISTAPRGAAMGVAVVTGATGGIGRAVTLRLARAGWTLHLVARDARRLAALARTLTGCGAAAAEGDAVHCHALDLTQPGGPEAWAKAQRDPFRETPPTLLINAAGVGLYRPTLDTDVAHADALMRLHYHAPMTLTRALAPRMVELGRGHVINVASIAATFGPWGHGPYAAAKAALVAATESLAVEHAGTGVHFSYVKPAIVRTRFFDEPSFEPLRRRIAPLAVDPDRVAQRIEQLLARPRLAVHVPRYGRIFAMLAAASPALARWIVRRNSSPPAGRIDRDVRRPASPRFSPSRVPAVAEEGSPRLG